MTNNLNKSKLKSGEVLKSILKNKVRLLWIEDSKLEILLARPS